MLAHAYEYVCAVDTYRNMSKAAASLYITQPALTKYINRLEAELDVCLFDRASSPIALTSAGKKFVEKARVILEIERDLLQDLTQISSVPHGYLNLGITTELCSMSMPHIVPRLKRIYPNIHLILTEGHERFILEELSKGRIELAIIPSPPFQDDLIVHCLQTENIILSMPAEHPIAQSYDLFTNSPLVPYYLDPELLKGADFIVCAPELGMGRFANEMFRKYQLNPNIVLEMRRNEAALRTASSGIGMVFTPVRTPLRVSLLKPMAYFSIENPLPQRRRCLCYPKHSQLSEAAKYFIPILKKVFQEEPDLLQPVCQLIRQPQIK